VKSQQIGSLNHFDCHCSFILLFVGHFWKWILFGRLKLDKFLERLELFLENGLRVRLNNQCEHHHSLLRRLPYHLRRYFDRISSISRGVKQELIVRLIVHHAQGVCVTLRHPYAYFIGISLVVNDGRQCLRCRVVVLDDVFKFRDRRLKPRRRVRVNVHSNLISGKDSCVIRISNFYPDSNLARTTVSFVSHLVIRSIIPNPAGGCDFQSCNGDRITFSV